MCDDLYVEEAGPGRPAQTVVLAHGFAGSARNWRPQIRALKDRYRIVSYDARGHARSPAPRAREAYSMEALVADLASVLDRLAVTQPALLGGLSLGAATVLRFALDHPSRARALVLASMPPGAGTPGTIGTSADDFARAIEEEGIDAAGARFVWGPDSRLDAAGARLVRQGFLEHTPHGLAGVLRGVLSRLPTPTAMAGRLADLDLPVLLIAGAADDASLAASRELVALLPRAQLEVIPGAGHVVNLAAPQAFNDALVAFADSL